MTTIKAVLMAMAIGLSACADDGGVAPDAGDVSPDAGSAVTLDGGWRLAVNLNPCIASPAPIGVTFEIAGDDVTVASPIAGESVALVSFEEDTVSISTEEGSEWVIALADDGETASALVTFTNEAGCSVETIPTVERF